MGRAVRALAPDDPGDYDGRGNGQLLGYRYPFLHEAQVYG
jgi:hypothetical protein